MKLFHLTLEDWIKKYEKKAEEFILLPGFTIHFEPDKGFFCWHVWQDVLEIDHTCTNDHKWLMNKLMELAKERNCTLLRTATLHDPVAFMRLFKGTVRFDLSGIRPNGIFYWVFERKVI